MKQVNVVKGYYDLELLKDKNFNAKDQWNIYNLRKTLLPHVEFQQEQEQKIAEKYQPKADKDGIIYGEDYISFIREKEDLDNIEIENIEKISLPLIDGIDFTIIEKLDNFVEFKFEQ